MKISNCLLALAVIVPGFGCRSGDAHYTSTAFTSQQAVQTTLPQGSGALIQQGSSGNFDYTIETILNSRLTPTSREGDRPTEVYSSNIIAVYVHPRTNSPWVPNPQNTTEPARR